MEKTEKKQNVIPFRYKFWWKVVTGTMRPVLKIFKNYTFSKPIKLPEPSIILANHATDWDALLLTACFYNQAYFIASENCFRKGIKSRILNHCFGLISKIKGASDTLAVMKAIRSLKEGKNVIIFPEGGRTFNGITDPINVATGKLVKVSGAHLVDIRISGGYMRIPRWGFDERKGPWSGKIVNIYTPEQLKQMSAQEITDCISKDLYENAYETQAIKPVKFRGKNLAVGMECAICVCPECKSIGNIKTKENTVYCEKCNTSTTIDEYAYFSEGFKFHTVTEWDLWQEDFYKNYIDNCKDNNTVLLSDENVCLKTFNADHETTLLGTGTFSLYKDRFSFTPEGKEPIDLPISKIPDTSVFSRSNFNFTNEDGIHYELYADRLFNVRKYFSCWKMLRAQIEQ